MPQISYSQEIFRKLIHLSSLWMVASLGVFPWEFNAFIFAFLFASITLIEYGNYKKWPVCVKTYGKIFGKMLRKNAESTKFKPSGAPYVLAAAFMVSVLFPAIIAMISLATMLIADTAAALVGRKLGRHKINNGTKSIEGAIAFWIASACVLFFFHSQYAFSVTFIMRGMLGFTCAMFAEIYEKQIHIDDNLSIPLIMGLFLYTFSN